MVSYQLKLRCWRWRKRRRDSGRGGVALGALFVGGMAFSAGYSTCRLFSACSPALTMLITTAQLLPGPLVNASRLRGPPPLSSRRLPKRRLAVLRAAFTVFESRFCSSLLPFLSRHSAMTDP